MKKYGFLAPFAALVATFAPLPQAMGSTAPHADIKALDALKPSAEGKVSVVDKAGDIFGFVLRRSDTGMLMAQHVSHESHSSHSSHTSHTSHVSSSPG